MLTGVLFANAQRQQSRSEKIQALKIAFITQKLELNPQEAQSFWPVYNQYQKELSEFYANKSENVLENEEKLLNIRKKYKPSFEKVLGPQKLNSFYNAERDFRNVLIRQLKNEHQKR
jgi:hypothetical protein